MYKRNAEVDKKREAHLEKVMYLAWLRESGETNEYQIEHLKNCVSVALRECLTDRQREYLSLYLSGYNGREISSMCGVAPSTVSRTLNRCLDNVISRIKYATPGTLHVDKRVKSSLTRLYRN